MSIDDLGDDDANMKTGSNWRDQILGGNLHQLLAWVENS